MVGNTEEWWESMETDNDNDTGDDGGRRREDEDKTLLKNPSFAVGKVSQSGNKNTIQSRRMKMKEKYS